jgi:hypothetical protein
MTDLAHFASDVYDAMIRASEARGASADAASPLLPLLTRHEPYRALAEQDANLLARLFLPRGLAMQVGVVAGENRLLGDIAHTFTD